jgi:hypothetical protein
LFSGRLWTVNAVKKIQFGDGAAYRPLTPYKAAWSGARPNPGAPILGQKYSQTKWGLSDGISYSVWEYGSST